MKSLSIKIWHIYFSYIFRLFSIASLLLIDKFLCFLANLVKNNIEILSKIL